MLENSKITLAKRFPLLNHHHLQAETFLFYQFDALVLAQPGNQHVSIVPAVLNTLLLQQRTPTGNFILAPAKRFCHM